VIKIVLPCPERSYVCCGGRLTANSRREFDHVKNKSATWLKIFSRIESITKGMYLLGMTNNTAPKPAITKRVGFRTGTEGKFNN